MQNRPSRRAVWLGLAAWSVGIVLFLDGDGALVELVGLALFFLGAFCAAGAELAFQNRNRETRP